MTFVFAVGTGTLNTREQNLSVQSSSVDGPSTIPESEVESAGVDPSVAGNVSPSSTITDTRVNNQDLRNFIEQQQEDVPEIQEREEENDPPSTRREDHVIEGSEEVKKDNSVSQPKTGADKSVGEQQTGADNCEDTQITEDGGDHEGFKQELREEYEKMTQEENNSKEGQDSGMEESQTAHTNG